MVLTRAQRRTRNDEGSEREEDDAINMDSRTKKLFDMVFGIDLLRETIIDYAIHDSGEDFSKKNALSCRLVQKSWLESVFKGLVKSGKPLVKFEPFDNKLETMSKICKQSSRLTFKLEATFYSATFEQNLKHLEKCLHLYGYGLVELNLTILLDKAVLQRKEKLPDGYKKRQSFTLPVLRKLVYSVPCLPDVANANGVNDDVHISSIPQFILSGCLRLKHFAFYAGCVINTEAIPASFGNLQLPPTITNLVLDCPMENNYLEPLMKNNPFPRLTDLSVILPAVIGEEKEWIYAVLVRVRNTLKTLGILCTKSEETGMNKIELPAMKCLERIFIRSKNFEWADGVSNLQQKLPALERMVIQNATSSSFKKWTENSKFAFLTRVNIMFDDDARSTATEFLTLENAQLMPDAFHMVTKLEISTPCVGNVNKALQYLFKNMTQLQVLTIILREVAGHVVHPRYMDALLLGTPCELIDVYKSECSREKLLEAAQFKLDLQCCVFNLSQLLVFSLEFKPIDDPKFVSEKVRELVVSAMPNLQKINLPFPLQPTRNDS